LKTVLGLNQKTISIFFNIINPNTQKEISRFCSQARDAIFKDFVPKWLGPNHLNRKEWLSHNSDLIKKLFDLQVGNF
jgi:hypothetical protein